MTLLAVPPPRLTFHRITHIESQPPMLPHCLQSAIWAWAAFLTSTFVDPSVLHVILSSECESERDAFLDSLRSCFQESVWADFMIAISPFTHTSTLTDLVEHTLSLPPNVRLACSLNPMTSVESLLILSVDQDPDVSLFAQRCMDLRIKSQTRVALSREWSLYHSALSHTLLRLVEK